MSEYVVTDTELTAVANAIRTKGGTSETLEWNADFISAINAISGGGEGAKNILSGTSVPTSGVGQDGDIYLLLSPKDIPSEYQPVEYIAFAGETYKQYIVIGSLKSSNDGQSIVEIEVSVPQGASQPSDGYLISRHVVGSNTANTDDGGIRLITGNAISHWGRNLQFCFYPVTDAPLTYGSLLYNVGTLDYDTKKIIKSVCYNTRTDRGLIVGNYNGYSGESTHSPVFNLYHVAFCDAFNVPYAYYQPCYRKADNVIGLYDLINEIFYSAYDSSTLSVGQNTTIDEMVFATYCKVNGAWQALEGTDIDDVNTEGGGGGVLSGESAPSASLGSDGDLYVQKMDLPDDVNFVEYLKSSGTQYINTGVYATQDIDATVTFDRGSGTSGSSANVGCALGVRTGGFSDMSKTIYFGSHTDYDGGISVIKTGSSNGGTVYNKTGVSTRRTKTYKDVNGYYIYCSTIDEVASYAKMYRQTGSWQSDHTLYMFAFYNSNTFLSANSAKVHRVTLFDKGVPIKDYLPCLDANNVPCMWDNIAKEYVYNDGTGTFAYGNTVTPTKISDVLYEKKNGAWVYVGDVDDVNTGE